MRHIQAHRLHMPARFLIAALLSALATTATGAAQDYWLIDEFAIEVGARENDLDTTIRVDALGGRLGTEFKMEDVLGVDASERNIGIAGEWLWGRKNLIRFGWAEYKRDAVRTLDRTIVIGDTVFPVTASVGSTFDIETIDLSWTYFFARKDRWAFGAGLGIRHYEYTLGVVATLNGQGLSESADVSGPMPYIGLDYRYGFSPRWRLRTTLGIFDVSIEDYEGTQVLGEVAVEYKALEHLSLGLAGDLGQLDVGTTANQWSGQIDSEIVGIRFFVRAIW